MLERAQSLHSTLSNFRRAIHRQPELGFAETATAALAAEHLRGLGMRVRTGVAKTGVIGYLGEGRPVVMLRADMDALQLTELNEVSYASQVPGMMHACGHDAHVACLLGAATLLAADPPPGQVRFLFQPSEEGSDADGKHGGQRVMEEGHVDDLDAVFGLHSEPRLPTGQIAVRSGTLTFASDTFRGAVLGRLSHGARPHEGLDAIALAAQVVTGLNQIVSRRVAPLDSAVVTVGMISGGTRPNIVAGRVELAGTLRSAQEETRQRVFTEVERAFRLAEVLGGGYELDIEYGCPAVVNDEALATLVRDVGENLLGHDNVRPGDPVQASEDFSFLISKAPGCFFRLGVGFPGEEPRVIHSATFDVNEAALPIGAAMLAGVARAFLERAGH
ncbi:MAG: M20 metallopeptidase family protein [Chloroflexota bacterium]